MGAASLAAAFAAHAIGVVETRITLTSLIVKDALGNVVPTVLAPTSIAQNSFPSSVVYTHGLINADGDYLEVTDYRRRLDLLVWSTHFTVPPGTDMSAKATTSGGFFNTLTASASADAFNASVNAQAEVVYDIFLPAHGSVTVGGTMFGSALSAGQPTGTNTVPHVAKFDTFLVFSPQFINGEVYRISGNVTSANPPFLPAEDSQVRVFSQMFVNPVGLDSYAHVDMIASAYVGNGALASAVPEPASWLMTALGLLGVAALARRRRV
ncbi:PEP-CTERM sorting domain-containing protein [Roseateles sp. P5_D6]